MEMEQIFALLDRFSVSPLTLLELELGDGKLRLEKGGVAEGVVVQVPLTETLDRADDGKKPEGTLVKAPLVGTFYTAPAPGKPPFVSVGERVEKGQTLCVLEAMKMLSEVPSPVSGLLLEVLAEDGELMGFDTPLFRIEEG